MADVPAGADEFGGMKVATPRPMDEFGGTPVNSVPWMPISHSGNPNLINTTAGTPQLRTAGATGTGAALEQQVVQGGKDAWQEANTPFVSIPKFTVNPNDHPAVAVGKEVVNIATSIPEFFETPLGIASAGVGSAGGAVARVISGGFSAQMLHALGQQTASTYDNWGKLTSAQKAAAVTDMIGSGAFAGLTGAHAAGIAILPSAKTDATPPVPPKEDWLPKAPAVPTDEFGGITQNSSSSPSSVETPTAPTPTAPQAEPAPAANTTPLTAASTEPSRIVLNTLDELMTARQPVPASLVQQSGIAPTTLAEGYKLNAAGNAYEFTPPEARLTPEQQMARDSVATVAALREGRDPAGTAAEVTPTAPEPTPASPRVKLLPVDVTQADIKRAGAGGGVERPPDVLDTIAEHYPNGVQFDKADHGETVKTARGAAAELMSHTTGEPADTVLKGMHENGQFLKLETADDLAQAMKTAGETRIKQRDNSSAALELARQQKRTELFNEASSKARAGKSEPLPANQLFVGDQFKVDGKPMQVTGHVTDAETGQPSHVEVEGAYGRQTIPADAVVHLDKGSLENTGLGQNILDKLDTFKMDTNGQLHAFGLAPAVWNTFIDGIKLAVRGGMAVKDAIDAGLAKLKASGTDLKDFNEEAARTHLNETLGTRQFGQQMQAATDINAATKEQLTNTLYTRRPQEDDMAFAQRIITTVGGIDQARAVFQDQTNSLPAPVRMAVGMQILKGLDAAGRHTDAANFFDNDLAPHTTDVAQGLAMLNAWHAMSKDGKLDWARVKILRAAKDATDPVRPDIEAAKTELQKQNAAGIERTAADPNVQTEAKAAVTDAVANSPETHAGVVMELTQPWASAKVILDMARQQVAAKANDLLTKQPRPIGFTAAQHLRAIMDDLAKRAADIAAGHYRGAEPGVILKDKLVQRLGIAPEAAGRLANALDKEFARQVEAAKNALPARIARQVEKAKQGLPVDAEETAVDRSIRKQLAEGKVKLGTLVREHWTKVDATGDSLKDKLVKQAGLTGDAAQKLADMIQRRFEALTAKAKASALEQLLKPVKRLGLAKPQMVDKLVQLSHTGAFDDAKFWNAIKERMDLPQWTSKLRDELNTLADKIGRIPEDRIQDLQRAQTEFLNTVERAKGVSNLELGLAFYMQNILSGLTTHVRVAIHTSAQMVAVTAAEMEQAMVQGRLHDIPLIFEALGRGAGRALTQQKDIMRSGMVVGSKLQKVVPLSVLEQIHFGRQGGTTVKQGPVAKAILENKAAGLLNLWKYNGRLITAQHMIYFAPAEEMKLALLASRQARTEGLTGNDAINRARQIMGYGAAQVRAAEAQAIREGLDGTRAKMRTAEILQAGIPKGMKETARDYALRQTFLNEPYGFAGAIAGVVNNAKNSKHPALATAARVIVPFTRIAANLFNEGLNYSPVGAARARLAKTQLLGQKFADISPEVRDDLKSELYAKAALGTMLLTGIAFKAAQGLNQPNPDFTVYGAGPSNPQDQQTWKAGGAIPYSAKIGGRYISYANTPGNVMLATLGNYLDGHRDAVLYQRPGAKRLAEDLPMRTAAATLGASKVILEQPFLQSMVEMSQIAGENNPAVAARGAVQTVARTASSFVVPNLLRQADRFFDPTSYDTKTLGGILTSQVPFVRQTGRPNLNALGQPVQSPVFGRFTSTVADDPVVKLLTQHNAWPSLPNRNQTAVNGVPLTDDDFYTYSKARGEALAKLLSQPNVGTVLDRVAQARDTLNQRATSTANLVAKQFMGNTAAKLQSEVMGYYEKVANEAASVAVERRRGY